MSSDHEKVLERIRKLLALAGNNDNPNESAAAAAQAAKLMERHQIMAADVDSGDEEDEDVTHFFFGPSLRRKSTWQGALAKVIAEAFGCAVCWRGSDLLIAGRPKDVGASVLARDYCHREIDRLTAYFAAGRGRGFGVSFRMGCVHSIHQAIEKERAELRQEMRDHVSETALVVVDQRVNEAMESFGKMHKVRSNMQGNDLAYATGIVTGRDIYQGTKPRLEG